MPPSRERKYIMPQSRERKYIGENIRVYPHNPLSPCGRGLG
jgi:hypothetical protein